MTPVFVTQLGFAACFHFFSLSSLVCSRFAAAIPIIRCATVLAAAASNTWHFLVSHCSVTLQHCVTQCNTPTLSCQTITKPVLPPPSPSPSHYYFCHQNIRFAAKWWKSDFASTLKIPKRWSPVLTGSLIAIRLNNPHKARIWEKLGVETYWWGNQIAVTANPPEPLLLMQYPQLGVAIARPTLPNY